MFTLILPFDVHQFCKHLVGCGDDFCTGLVSALCCDHVDKFLGDIRVGNLKGVGLDFAKATGSCRVRCGFSGPGRLPEIVPVLLESGWILGNLPG